MANIYGTTANGATVIVGEMDDSVMEGIASEACGSSKKGEMSNCGGGKKKKKRACGESFESKKARLVGGKKMSKKPGKGTPEGDEDAITDPEEGTPGGIGNTAKDKGTSKKKKKGTASESCGSKKKGC